MLIVDSQVHIWQDARLGAHHRQIPTFSKDDLLREMDEAGVSAAVICPPFSLPQVNDLACDAARQHPGRLCVMGFFPIDKPDSRETIKTWKARPGMKGLRWVLNQPQHKQWFEDGTLDWLWPAVEREGLPVALLHNDNLAAVGRVAARHPGLKLAIDHLGCISGSKDAAAFASLADLLALASHENVSVKLSGAPSNSSAAYPWRNIHDDIHRIFDAFGPTRCFWGTDITRLGCSWRQAVTMFTEELPWLKGGDLELVMGQALCDWLDWDIQHAK